jgi:hypothetical protein
MASAAIPPPPVNQNLGIPDTSFSNFSQELCQACHWASAREIDTLSGAPVKPGYNPNRHHLALNPDVEIDGIPEFPPFRDADGDGVNDTRYSCLNCHIINTQGVDINTAVLTDIVEFNFRNCLNCHDRPIEDNRPGRLTVHHTTELAQTGFCFRCHGGLVRGIDVDTHLGKKPDPNNVGGTVPVVIPDYQTSMITPWRSNKPNGDASRTNHAGTEPGNCNFCHNTAEGSTVIHGGEGGTIETVNLPDGSTFEAPILSNAQNHHNTGFFDDNRCAWCHEIDNEFQSGSQSIRVCQRCHDRSTLHNIEFDRDGDGITAGQEDAYYGHIGNQNNCWGCHGNDFRVENENGEWVDPRENFGLRNQGVVVSNDENARASSVISVLIPVINTLSTQSVSSGEEVMITIDGMNIVNSTLKRVLTRDDNGNLVRDENGVIVSEMIPKSWSSEVVVTDKNNNNIVITPDYQDTNKIEFTLPATLQIGTYQVSLKKEGQVSNPIGLTVTPSINTQQALVFTPYGGLVLLFGENFMDAVNGMGYYIVDENGNVPTAVYVWQDNFVAVLFDEIPENVTVKTLFDEKTIPLEVY